MTGERTVTLRATEMKIEAAIDDFDVLEVEGTDVLEKVEDGDTVTVEARNDWDYGRVVEVTAVIEE